MKHFLALSVECATHLLNIVSCTLRGDVANAWREVVRMASTGVRRINAM